jgi:hypothetical protein
MAEFSSPILGGIRVARSTVSSSVFGRNPRAAAPSGPDPQTIGILTRNELALTSVSNQISGMSQQIMSLSAALQQIGVSIANDSALDKRRELQNQNQERILAQQQLREGKESIIEKKMQSALISPVAKIAAKAKFTLERVGQFFTILLSGWIANQSIQAIQALITKNKKRLEEIKSNVIKNLGVVGGILLAINGGLSALLNASRRVVAKITSSVVGGLFLKPVVALINAVKDAGKGLLNIVKPPTPPPKVSASASASAAETTAEAGAKVGEAEAKAGAKVAGAEVKAGAEILETGAEAGLKGGKNLFKGALGFGSKLLAPISLGIAGYRYSQGDMVGGSLSAASAVPVLGWPAIGLDVAREFGAFEGTFLGKNENKKSAKTAAAPKESENKESQDFSKPPEFGTMNIAPVAGESGADSQAAAVTPQGQPTDYSSVFSNQAQIQPLKSQESQQKMQSVGPLPEPQPTVVMAPSPPAPAQSAPSGGNGRVANNVPAISSSNPDNFYVLYSQAHYNVVI